MKRSLERIGSCLLLLAVTLSCAQAEPIAFVDENEFQAAVAALAVAAGQEGFEQDALWGDVRTSIIDGVHSAPR